MGEHVAMKTVTTEDIRQLGASVASVDTKFDTLLTAVQSQSAAAASHVIPLPASYFYHQPDARMSIEGYPCVRMIENPLATPFQPLNGLLLPSGTMYEHAVETGKQSYISYAFAKGQWLKHGLPFRTIPYTASHSSGYQASKKTTDSQCVNPITWTCTWSLAPCH